MTSLARIRPSLRRAAFVAALGALMVPATAGASVHAHAAAKHKQAKPPVVTRVAPMQVAIGQTLEIRGRNFRRGRSKNTVVFKRTGGKAVFVKAGIGTTKLLLVTVPARLQAEMVSQAGATMPTLFRVRVLAKKFGKRFTKASISPVISPRAAGATPGPGGPAGTTPNTPAEPEADGKGEGISNRVRNK